MRYRPEAMRLCAEIGNEPCDAATTYCVDCERFEKALNKVEEEAIKAAIQVAANNAKVASTYHAKPAEMHEIISAIEVETVRGVLRDER